MKWAVPPYCVFVPGGSPISLQYNNLPEFDYRDALVRMDNGSFATIQVEQPALCSLAGNIGSSCFAMAIDLETSNGGEISGLNAEEQSDISLIARWNLPQASGFVFDVYTYIDSMIVLRENNVVFNFIVGSRINSIKLWNQIMIRLNILSLSTTF